MKIEDIKPGMKIYISPDTQNKSFKVLGSNISKMKLAGTVQTVNKIIFQESNHRYLIRIKGNHWFAKDLMIFKTTDIHHKVNIQTEPQLFDPKHLIN